MSKTAFVFPGQGSQQVGMGRVHDARAADDGTGGGVHGLDRRKPWAIADDQPGHVLERAASLGQPHLEYEGEHEGVKREHHQGIDDRPGPAETGREVSVAQSHPREMAK